jgi:hypothetical protein
MLATLDEARSLETRGQMPSGGDDRYRKPEIRNVMFATSLSGV